MQNGNAVSKTHNWGVKWTADEDQRLIHGIELYGENDWKKVSDVVATRAPVKCIQRWEKVLRPDLIKGKWTDEEDEMLKAIVFKGFEHWGKVADQMPGRTSKQCRERWANYLDPSLLKTAFTQAEDDAVMRLQSEFGNKWAYIARLIPGRTENSVKLRYHALVKQFGEKNSATVGASGNKPEDRLLDAISASDKVLQALKKPRTLKHTGGMISDELLLKQVMLDPSLLGSSSSSSNLSSAEQQMLRLHHKQQQQHFHHLQQLQQHHLIQQQREQQMLQQQQQSQHFPSNLHHQMQIQQQFLLQQQLMNQQQQQGPLSGVLPIGHGLNASLLQSSQYAAETAGSQQLSTTMLPTPATHIGPSHGPTPVPQFVLPAPSAHPHSLQQQQQSGQQQSGQQQLQQQQSGQQQLQQQHQQQTSYLMVDIDDFIQQNSKKSTSDSGSSASGPGTE